MSGSGFHVHGPHDHELEHAAHGDHGDHGDAAHHGIGGRSMTNQIAVCTAVLATVGAIFSYMGGATQANAGLFKNNAAIKKTEAANQWNYFQAKSTKQSLAEFARDLAPESARTGYQEKVQRSTRKRPRSSWWRSRSRKKRPSGTGAPTNRCTSTTAGPSPPRRCRWPSRSPPWRC